jgi:mono/diheme cytochrome c family protein
MEFLPYKELSDADTQAIIAYLRSLPAAQTNVPTGDNINFIGALMTGAGVLPPSTFGAETVTAPPEGVTAEYGKYVATYGECRGCHGPDMTGVAESSLGPAIPNPRPLIGTLTQAQFFEMMRTGVKPGGAPFPETMPWQNAAQMTDDDLAALYLYVTAAP